MEREILHIRLLSMLSAVEQMRRPELRGRAVIVAAPQGNTSGVVICTSKAALKHGISEGMSIRQAQRLCPDAAIVKADWAAYKLVFNGILDILYQYSPQLEPDSVGSAYIDITGSKGLLGNIPVIMRSISAEISKRMDVSVGIGHASNKLVARMASGIGAKYPSTGLRMCRVRPGGEARFLAPMPVTALDLNANIIKRLDQLGISTIGQLAGIPERSLIRQFGPIASLIKRQSIGIDFTAVKAAYPPDVIITEHTFACNATEVSAIEPCLNDLASQVSMILRKQGALAGEVALELFDDSDTGFGAKRENRENAKVRKREREKIERIDESNAGFGTKNESRSIQHPETGFGTKNVSRSIQHPETGFGTESGSRSIQHPETGFGTKNGSRSIQPGSFRDFHSASLHSNPETHCKVAPPAVAASAAALRFAIRSNRPTGIGQIKKPTDSAYTISQVLVKLLNSAMTSGMEISKVRVTISDLAQGQGSQLSLIGNSKRAEQIDKTVQLIRNRFGEGSVYMASSLVQSGRAGILERIMQR